MTSQLNVDTIVDKAGSGGSNVKMANTSTYVSDGGNVTQNTVQGLAKAWVNFTGVSSTAARDSFNVASLTDSGTGHTTIAFTNNMSNGTFTGSWFTNSDASSGITNLSNNYAGNFAIRLSSSYQTQCWATNGGADAFHNDSTIFGDLA